MTYVISRLFTRLRLVVLSLLIITALAPEWPAFQDERYQLDTIIDRRHFDFVIWEANALAVKGQAWLTGGQDYLTEGTKRQFVLDYLSLLSEIQRLEAQISVLYADPEVSDPVTESQPLQEEANRKRDQLDEWQPLAEAIVQEQVGTVLAEEGFDILDQVWPPVQMHMTPLPYILIVSPREEIRQIYNIPLEAGLSVTDQEELEDAILRDLDRSALVVPIAGVGFYPAMILETSSINYLADVVAHEWAHHWLTLHPLGLNYYGGPVLRTANETVASIVGTEVGAQVIERFYPEFVPDPVEPPAEEAEESDQPPRFDFNAEMAKTRIQAEELLAEGKIVEAENYMEARRQLFWDNGYRGHRTRKINQAYFAFYGAYADTPGEAGADPIGPALLALRENSASLRDFMDRVASITSLSDLQEVTGPFVSQPQ